MSRALIWLESAELELLRLPPSEAESVMRAVESLAERGVGFVRRMIPSGDLRLYTGTHVVAFLVDNASIVILRVEAFSSGTETGSHVGTRSRVNE